MGQNLRSMQAWFKNLTFPFYYNLCLFYPKKPNQVDIAGVEGSSEEADGENYVFTFRKKDSTDSFECLQDRMFNLVGEQVGDWEAIYCKTPENGIPSAGSYKLKLTIDGKDSFYLFYRLKF